MGDPAVRPADDGGREPGDRDTAEDLAENPTLAEMTAAALTFLQNDPEGSWLMV